MRWINRLSLWYAWRYSRSVPNISGAETGCRGCIRPATSRAVHETYQKENNRKPRGEDPVNPLTTTTTVNCRNINGFCRNISLALALVLLLRSEEHTSELQSLRHLV